MTAWLRNNSSVVWSWAVLIVAAAIIFGVTRGSQFGQLGIGLLTGAIALLVVMAIFEMIWQTATGWGGSTDDKQAPERTRKHRQRGQ